MKNKKQNYGTELIIDLHDCDPKIISSKERLRNYVIKLCNLMKMKKYGPLLIERFGEKTSWGEGFSFMQFIETSSIVGHLLEEPINSAYINIFSCERFNTRKAREFTKNFFKAKKIKNRILIR